MTLVEESRSKVLLGVMSGLSSRRAVQRCAFARQQHSEQHGGVRILFVVGEGGDAQADGADVLRVPVPEGAGAFHGRGLNRTFTGSVTTLLKLAYYTS